MSGMYFRSTISVLIVVVLLSCGGNKNLLIPQKSEIVGLASMITLPSDTGRIDLTDYFIDVSRIDSVSKVEGLKLKLQPGKEYLHVDVVSKLQPLMELKVWVKDTTYSLIMRPSMQQRYRFEVKNITSAKKVQLAGDFNNWNPAATVLMKEGDVWVSEMFLNPGKYSYKVVVDSLWKLDLGNPDSTSNGMGGFNSVRTIKGPDDTKTPFITSEKVDGSAIVFSATNSIQDLMVLWENSRLPESCIKKLEKGFEITLPEACKAKKRSSLRVYAYNEAGAGNDVTLPLANGAVITDAQQLTRDDFHTAILYFMMVDRFFDGDTSNNQPVNDSRVDFKANYQGGDLQGIKQKIEDGYFKKLGVNTLWFSPIVQNPDGAYQEYPEPRRWFSGYHGYWPIRSTEVDYRMGDKKTLKELVKLAHQGNTNVLMDFVSNHIHNEHPIFKQKPEWFSSMYTPDGRVNIRIWDEHRLTTWFDTFMPDIDYTKPEAVNAFSDSALYWVKEFGLDGFRHDATKHVSEVFWRALTRKLKNNIVTAENRNLYQIGETFGSRELIGSYISSGMMDAQFDFNLYFDARSVFAGQAGSFESVAASLKESARYYGCNSLMGNITGNHDMPRFMYYAGGSQVAGEDEKEAGWKRNIEVIDTNGFARIKMLHAFIMSIPGVPVVYYGDEIGMTGANDPDNRRMMKFSGLNRRESDVLETVSKLCKFRQSSMPLLYGTTKVIRADADVLVLQRSYLGKHVFLILNRSVSKQNIRIVESYPSGKITSILNGNKVMLDGEKIAAELSPLSFEIVSIE
jgi:cyclomaltodextrinase